MDAVVHWVRANGGFVDDNIEFRERLRKSDHCERSRSVFSKVDLAPDHVLFRLPKHCLLRPENMHSRVSQYTHRWKEMFELSDWETLIIAMMYEMRHVNSSFWSCYLQFLPSKLLTPRFWSSKQQEALKGSSAWRTVISEDLMENFNTSVRAVLEAETELFPNVDFNEEFERFRLIGSLVMAYSFTLSEEDDDNKDVDCDDEDEDEMSGIPAMVPIADAFNHRAAGNNVCLYAEGEFVAMRTLDSVCAGSELFNTYGELPNAQLLCRYGFTEAVNPFDSVELDGANVLHVCERENSQWSRIFCELNGADIALDEHDAFPFTAAATEERDILLRCPPHLLMTLACALVPFETVTRFCRRAKMETHDLEEELERLLVVAGRANLRRLLRQCFLMQRSALEEQDAVPAAVKAEADTAEALAISLRKQELCIWDQLLVPGDDTRSRS